MSGADRRRPGRGAVAVVVVAVLVAMWQALAPGYSDELPTADRPALCTSPGEEPADKRRPDFLKSLHYMAGFDYADSSWARGFCPPDD